ncbi:MAG: hypothetical protein QXZ38_00160 [Candidatus Micrarchaeaceae archaeon]
MAMAGATFKKEKITEVAYIYLKYDIDEATAERIKKAIDSSEAPTFQFLYETSSIMLTLHPIVDYSKNLNIVLPVDKHIEEIRYIAENMHNYKMEFNIIEAGNKSSFEILFKRTKDANN